MTTEGKTRPMCQWCGRDLRKSSTTYWVVRDPSNYKGDDAHRHLQGPLLTREECQRLVNNGMIISIRYARPDHEGGIRSFNVWDGESFEASHGFFCTNACAMDQGHAAAKAGLHGPGYAKRTSGDA